MRAACSDARHSCTAAGIQSHAQVPKFKQSLSKQAPEAPEYLHAQLPSTDVSRVSGGDCWLTVILQRLCRCLLRPLLDDCRKHGSRSLRAGAGRWRGGNSTGQWVQRST